MLRIYLALTYFTAFLPYFSREAVVLENESFVFFFDIDFLKEIEEDIYELLANSWQYCNIFFTGGSYLRLEKTKNPYSTGII